ncbi:MAG: hypothetical protein N3H31_05750 [Candidatus Nezhaarchaeota archaeon]|nr:hypothetical protein [Candidatus Nezhaarchaeota archaeon]
MPTSRMEGPCSESKRALARAIVEAIEVLGPSVGPVIFHYLKVKAGVDKNELYRRPEALVEVIREIFGPLSSFIEEQIAKQVVVKLKIKAPLSLSQILSLVSKGVGLSPSVVVEAGLRGRLSDIFLRASSLLEQLGARLTEIKIEKQRAVIKAEGGCFLTASLTKYYREVEAVFEERGETVKALLKITLPGAVLSSEEREKLKGVAEKLIADLRAPRP